MFKRLKLIHPAHSGKIKPHEYTSYIPLAFLLLMVGITLGTYTVTADDHPAPIAGSIGIVGTMPGEPPTEAATIQSPASEQRFYTTPVTISGECPDNNIVQIFKNDIFAGSTTCTSEGKFSIDIDLLYGKNTILAKVYDSLNQAGPDSNLIDVYYDTVAAQSTPILSSDYGGSQLLLNTSAVFRGVFPENEFSIPVSILSGEPPYAVNIQWGDSTNLIVSRDNSSTFNASHSYKKAGTYQITIQATDASERVAFLSVTAVVNGLTTTVATTTIPNETTTGFTSKILVLWPLYVAMVAAVISFWLGEQRERKILRLRGLLLSTN